jgi:hypothetical protein
MISETFIFFSTLCSTNLINKTRFIYLNYFFFLDFVLIQERMNASIEQSKARIADALADQNYHEAIQVINCSLCGIFALKYHILPISRFIRG